jgi:hypothetical protein
MNEGSVLSIRVASADRQRWQAAADLRGVALSQFVKDCVERELGTPEEEAPEPAEPEPLRHPGVSQEDYVRREVEITRHQLETGQLKDVDKDGKPLKRLERSEAYARWRWRGVQDGSIASL